MITVSTSVSNKKSKQCLNFTGFPKKQAAKENSVSFFNFAHKSTCFTWHTDILNFGCTAISKAQNSYHIWDL